MAAIFIPIPPVGDKPELVMMQAETISMGWQVDAHRVVPCSRNHCVERVSGPAGKRVVPPT